MWNQRQFFINNVFDSEGDLRFAQDVQNESRNSSNETKNSHVSAKGENGNGDSACKGNAKRRAKHSQSLGIFAPPLPKATSPRKEKTKHKKSKESKVDILVLARGDSNDISDDETIQADHQREEVNDAELDFCDNEMENQESKELEETETARSKCPSKSPFLPMIAEHSMENPTRRKFHPTQHTPRLSRPYLERENTRENLQCDEFVNTTISLPHLSESKLKDSQPSGSEPPRENVTSGVSGTQARGQDENMEGGSGDNHTEDVVLCEDAVIKKITSTLPMSLMVKANHNVTRLVTEQKQKLIEKCRLITTQKASVDPRFIALQQTLQHSPR